jgi:UDP-N-acetylmuramate dehydrogenase
MNKSAFTLAIHENVPLAPYTTLGVGGPARFLARAGTEDQAAAALDFARAEGCPLFILGSGSNILVSDAGFPGLVLKIEISGIQSNDKENSRISVGAGVHWDFFAQYCVNRDLAGIECLSGIPGTVGGAPVQNVGAYGQEVAGVIDKVRVLDRDTGGVAELSNADCCFSYRSSIFNTSHKDRCILLNVDFILEPGGKPRLDYEELQLRFGQDERIPSIGEVRASVLDIRKAKGMLLIDGDSDSKSAGSFFMNPVLNPDAALQVEEKARARGILAASGSIPRFAAPGGREKLPAAWLIERAGFHKGYACGRAAISRKHALALINLGGASAQDILDLMRRIQDRVREAFGIELQPEPVFVGFKTEIQ